MKIGQTFQDPVEFLRMRAQALNEEGLWVNPPGDGKMVQEKMKRGEAKGGRAPPHMRLPRPREKGCWPLAKRKNLGKI